MFESKEQQFHDNGRDAAVFDENVIAKRLGALKAEQFPLGHFFWQQLAGKLEQDDKHPQILTKLSEEFGEASDPYSVQMDKESLDQILAGWAAGTTNDDQVLTQLMPFALRYHYGTSSDDNRKEGEPTLTEAQKKDLPFAQLVTDIWYAIKRQAKPEVGEKHEHNLDSVICEHLLGMDGDEIGKALRKHGLSKSNKEFLKKHFGDKFGNSCHSL